MHSIQVHESVHPGLAVLGQNGHDELLPLSDGKTRQVEEGAVDELIRQGYRPPAGIVVEAQLDGAARFPTIESLTRAIVGHFGRPA